VSSSLGLKVRRRFTGDNAIQVDRFGIGVSGAVAISSVDDKVIATVNHSGRMASASAGRSDVPFAVLAENDTILLSNTGGLATRTAAGEEKVSTGLSGAVSVIIAGSEVEASLRRAVIDAFRIDVAATNARRIGTVAASGAGGAVGGAGSLTVNFAGSVAVNAQAPHPNAARLAANFLLSREGQTTVAKYGRLPVRTDVTPTPPDAISKLGDVRIMPLEFSPEEEKLWQKRYQDYLRGR
jgi:hypothetical protein